MAKAPCMRKRSMVRIHSNQLSGYCGRQICSNHFKKSNNNRSFARRQGCKRSGDNPERKTRTLFGDYKSI